MNYLSPTEYQLYGIDTTTDPALVGAASRSALCFAAGGAAFFRMPVQCYFRNHARFLQRIRAGREPIY